MPKVQYCNGRPYELPDGFDLLCSQDWQFTGPADGVDLWDRWTVHGPRWPTAPVDSFVRPWLDHPIVVVGYEMTKLDGPPHDWFAIGSGIVADIFLWMGAGETRADRLFPKGLGHPWPSAEEALKPGFNNMIDIHGSAAGPPSRPRTPVGWIYRRLRKLRPPTPTVSIELTVYYTPL